MVNGKWKTVIRNMRSIVVIAHNLRSAHNVGSLLRTSEGLGVSKVYLTGYTPYPQSKSDERLPHIAKKVNKMVSKTALGAENQIKWSNRQDVLEVITQLKKDGYKVIGLEQTPKSISLPKFEPPEKIAIILGREVEGLEKDIINQCDGAIEIPMFGMKESFNVVQAAAMAIYHCRFN